MQAHDFTAKAMSLIQTVYGSFPPASAAHGALLHRIEQAGAVVESWRVASTCVPERPFLLRLLRPVHWSGRVILSGDGCWRTIDRDAENLCLENGFALAVFNRCEIAPDPPWQPHLPAASRVPVPVPAPAPNPMPVHGAIALWAWGYQRAIDVLLELPAIDAKGITVTGHSRGGKAALLAGATDGRISLTHANNSGLFGAGSTRVQGKGSETLRDMLQQFPHWLASTLTVDTVIPHDQDVLLSSICPRSVLITQALGDAWANPRGTALMTDSARRAHAENGATQTVHAVYRSGGHAQTFADWQVLVDTAKLSFDRA